MILAYLFNSNQLKESVSEDVVYTLTCNPVFFFFFFFFFFVPKKHLIVLNITQKHFLVPVFKCLYIVLKKIYLSSVAELREDW